MKTEMSMSIKRMVEDDVLLSDPNYHRHYSFYHALDLEKPCSDIYDSFRAPHLQSEIVCVNDDVDSLIQFLLDWSPTRGHELLSFDLFRFDAVKCVTAILDGETEGLFDFTTLVSLIECKPLELAAAMAAHRLTKLLLALGDPHDPNLRDSENQLPLNLTLEPRFRWDKPTESIFQHLVSFCDCPHRHHLETLRVLALHTRDSQQEFIKYAMEGSVYEVAQFLIVALDKVMPCVPYLRSQLLEKITSLLLHDVTFSSTSVDHPLTQKRMFLQVTLALFEIFEKAGDKLFAHLRVPQEHCNNIREDLSDIFEGVGISIDNMDKFASNLYYRSVSELFTDQKISPATSVLKHKGVTPVGVYGLEGLFNPKAQGQLEETIRCDDSHELVNLVAYQMKRVCLTNERLFSASELLRSICYHKSVECATALLESKTDLNINLNTALEDGIYPLHLAAISLSPGLTQLFLRHGALTKVQYDNSCSPYHGMNPLELALESLCHHRCVSDWTSTKSIYKLIYIFCLPELAGPMMTIQLLLNSEIMFEKISSLCVKEGKLVELCALLMVSSYNEVLPHLPGHDDVGSTFVGQYI